MTSPRVPVLHPPPEWFGDALARFERDIETCIQSDGPGLILDLSAVTFVGSEALASMIQTSMKLEKGQRRLALAAAPRRITRILATVGLAEVLPHFKSVATAQAYVADGHAPA